MYVKITSVCLSFPYFIAKLIISHEWHDTLSIPTKGDKVFSHILHVAHPLNDGNKDHLHFKLFYFIIQNKCLFLGHII